MKKQRIGVYICHCGGNIADVVDVERVAHAVEDYPGVVVAKNLMFVCSDAGQKEIYDDIHNLHLDGVVVASCSPKLHEITFMNTVERAGLNRYEFYHVNIREDVSWAHSDDPEGATNKAIREVKAGINYVRLTQPLEEIKVSIYNTVLIIGGGIAGLRCAIDTAKMGSNVIIVEKIDRLGGNVCQIHATYPDGESGREVVNKFLRELHEYKDKVKILLNSEISDISGYVGNFEVNIKSNDTLETTHAEVGSIIIATGFASYQPSEGEFGYKISDRIVTLPEFLKILKKKDFDEKVIYNGNIINSVGFIYCVGSRQEQSYDETKKTNEYCSRFCCNATIYTSSILHKQYNMRTYHFFRDMRTYGKYEQYYIDARNQGAIFLKYDLNDPPLIHAKSNKIHVVVKDILTENEKITVPLDLLVLVTGMEAKENTTLNDIIRVSIGIDGFYKESHPKLKPVETERMGIILAGSCQAPRDISETIASASAASAKASTIVRKAELKLNPAVAIIDPDKCQGHENCIAVCPVNAIEKKDQKPWVNDALCIGCGACTAVCPNEAIQIKTLKNDQIKEMILALAPK